MSREDRLARLLRVQNLLANTPQGSRAEDVARYCEVSRRTAYRDLMALQEAKYPVRNEGGRWFLDPSYRLRPVNLTLDEAIALFVASRLAHHHADERNHGLEGAFEKLASVLPPTISRHVVTTVGMMRSRPLNSDYSRAMEVITRAWAEGRTARIWYSRPGDAEPRERRFDPYFIEPSAAGRATYAIGHDHLSNELRIFKIERIRSIELTDRRFSIPDDFEVERFLHGRWTIGFGDEIAVVLRFSPSVAPRVRETTWHPSQTLTAEPDGSLTMQLRVAGSLEITPWILSWGNQVEVIGPPDLRRSIAEIALEQARRYLPAAE